MNTPTEKQTAESQPSAQQPAEGEINDEQLEKISGADRGYAIGGKTQTNPGH